MAIVLTFVFTVIPALLLAVVAGITDLPGIDYEAKVKEKAKSVYQQTGVLPASVSYLGRNFTVNADEIDLSDIYQTNYRVAMHKRAVIEQAIVNACITVYTACGRDSRMTPVYNALRYSNLSISPSVSVAPDKNGHLSFNTTHSGGGNAYTYYGIWNGAYTIVAGDVLAYDVFLPVGLPSYIYVGAFEMDFSDATFGRSYALLDQNGRADFANLTTYSGKWYHREFSLAPVSGKTIQYFDAVNESDTAGTYSGILYKNIQIKNGNIIKLRIWDPSYLWAFLDMKDGLVSTLLTSGTTQMSINCATATETEFNQYGKHLLRNAVSTAMTGAVSIDGTAKNFYYSKPAGGAGCNYADVVELR